MSPSTPPEAYPITSCAWRTLCRRMDLSLRETQIARGVMEDLKECAIADRLHISSHTVHTHLERLYRKLHVDSRVQLVVLLARRHLELTTEAGSALPPICARYAAGLCRALQGSRARRPTPARPPV